jgi:hypothetical protein
VFSRHGKGDARDSHYLSILITVGLQADLKSVAAAAWVCFPKNPGASTAGRSNPSAAQRSIAQDHFGNLI